MNIFYLSKNQCDLYQYNYTLVCFIGITYSYPLIIFPPAYHKNLNSIQKSYDHKQSGFYSIETMKQTNDMNDQNVIRTL